MKFHTREKDKMSREAPIKIEKEFTEPRSVWEMAFDPKEVKQPYVFLFDENELTLVINSGFMSGDTLIMDPDLGLFIGNGKVKAKFAEPIKGRMMLIY